jgi:hypothetical protein
MVKGKIEIYNFLYVLFLMCFVFAFIVPSRKAIIIIITYVDNIYFEKLMVKCVCDQDVICSRERIIVLRDD